MVDTTVFLCANFKETSQLTLIQNVTLTFNQSTGTTFYIQLEWKNGSKGSIGPWNISLAWDFEIWLPWRKARSGQVESNEDSWK